MLLSLDIRDMLIIDRLELAFQPGLNVLTGETGAGKSILLDALGFVLGWRGRADLVRSGASQGEVQAVFGLTPDHSARAVLDAAGLPVGDELILRRINSADGRKTAYVNDRRASGELLRNLSETLVELHGQHDDRGLLNPRGHRALLDDFARAEGEVAAVRAAWRDLRTAEADLAASRAALAAAEAEEDFLRHSVAELDQLAPEAGEDGALDQKRRLMQAAERIRDDIAKAAAAISAEGAENQLGNALRWLEGVSGQADGQLDAVMGHLAEAMGNVAEAQQGIERVLQALSFDSHEMETLEERLFAIRALARKHGVQPDDLGAFADDLRGRLAALERGGQEIAIQEAAVTAAQSAYDTAAAGLSAARQAAARSLDAAMADELAPLRMERARFETVISAGEPGAEGRDQVTFRVATNPGAPAGPLNKIASGGELSRFLLALKVCLTAGTSGLTMIFDEIDRGVGGATADAVGRRLRALAERSQVLVVTHSPQVAALGGHHWRVEKSVVGEETRSSVLPLAAPDRVDEIARMLSGDRITDAAREAARALLAS